MESAAPSIARAAVDGASREELLCLAVRLLAGAKSADRIGVWLRLGPLAGIARDNPGPLHGFVWDAENFEAPREWTHLSVEAPLPYELLTKGNSIEQDLEDVSQHSFVGPLLGLRRALWVPVTAGGILLGLILLGNRGRHGLMAHQRAEAVAAQLALALRFQQEANGSFSRKADLDLAHQVLHSDTRNQLEDAGLQMLADSCTSAASGGGSPGADFAFIGLLQQPQEVSEGEFQVDFRWKSGDAQWAHAIESPPVERLWCKALNERRMVGGQPPPAWSQKAVERILAFPLESDGQLLGALVTGLSCEAASLTNLEHLEWRAALAAAALRKRRLKEEERQQGEWQRALLNASREPLIVVDQNGGMISVSRGARDLATSGLGEEKQFQGLFRSSEREGVEHWWRDVLERDARAALTHEAELLSGLRVRLRAESSRRGKYLAIALEPCAMAAAQQTAERTETELRSVLEWLEEGVVLFDAHDDIRAMNTRFQQIAGIDPQESSGIKTLDDLISRLEGQAAEPRQFAGRWRQLARGIEGGIREEVRFVHPVSRTLERAARPVLDSAGRPLGRVEIYRDLTAYRLFQSKLLQTEKLASLGRMVSGIAHELSNPLTSILGNAQRLLSSKSPSAFSEHARRILEEAERASAILRQLLLNARETLPERRLVSINQIVLRATDLQRFTLEAQRIRLEIDLDPVLLFVHGDPGQLQQVLINLVSNAQQAIEQQGGGGIIRLRTRAIGERRVLLEVEDTGPGVPEAIQARIFDPFFTTKPAGVGTGLGLAIVLSIVREHGGQVRVKNTQQGGAVFQVELPAVAEIPQQVEVMKPELPPQEQRMVSSGRPRQIGTRKAARAGGARCTRVLVVEDEPTVARLIGDVLEDEGMEVDVLLDGREALDHVARQRYDMVVCDMRMPGLDGQHFYQSLARSGNSLQNRFLFVTGDIVAAQTREFLEKNKLPHVAKPFRVEELTEKVYLVLGGLPPREAAGVGA